MGVVPVAVAMWCASILAQTIGTEIAGLNLCQYGDCEVRRPGS